jgi:glycosyltransferase involved in cell wall biosynthesis
VSDLRYKILRKLFSLQPFDIIGDANIIRQSSLAISCIIPTLNRLRDLDTILCCLCMQHFDKDSFEVIVVEDGSTEAGRVCCERYQSRMNIRLIQSTASIHSVGALRNEALKLSSGTYLLFLDDDTRILQADFLQLLYDRFGSFPAVDCVQIAGNADRCLKEFKYSYLDKFSFATRCVAYRRDRLVLIGGFIDSLKSYEDIEMSIRFILSGALVCQAEELQYYHPPLFFESLRKTITNGLSFLTLFPRYSFVLWMMCYLNACRFLPLLISPSLKQRQWGKISAGFIIAPLYKLFRCTDIFYR